MELLRGRQTRWSPNYWASEIRVTVQKLKNKIRLQQSSFLCQRIGLLFRMCRMNILCIRWYVNKSYLFDFVFKLKISDKKNFWIDSQSKKFPNNWHLCMWKCCVGYFAQILDLGHQILFADIFTIFNHCISLIKYRATFYVRGDESRVMTFVAKGLNFWFSKNVFWEF